MQIIYTTKVKQDIKKLEKQHKQNELEKLDNIKNLLLSKENFDQVLNDNFSKIYRIEKKKGNLKELYTAHLNQKIRLWMKPIGDYPYQNCSIEEIEFIKIDDKHYGDG